MTFQRGLRCTLVAALLSGSIGLVGQTPVKTSGRGTYYIKLTTPALNTPEQMAAWKNSALHSSAYWDNLYNVGKVAIVGAAKDGSSGFNMVILEGVSQAEAVSIANGDPSVRAGVTTVEVLPLQVFQAKDQTRPKPGR